MKQRANGAVVESRPDRKMQIVTAAAAVLGRQGYANTSLKQVAQEAGIAPGLLHYYFQSKEDLLLEVVAAIERQLTADWDMDVQGIADPMARINTGMERAVANVTGNPEFIRLLLDTYALASTQSRSRTWLEGFCSRIQSEIETMAGIIPGGAGVDPEVLDFPGAIAGAINGIAFTSLVRDKSPAAAYNAFKMYVLGLAAVAYTASGVELPSELADLLRGQPRKQQPVS